MPNNVSKIYGFCVLNDMGNTQIHFDGTSAQWVAVEVQESITTHDALQRIREMICERAYKVISLSWDELPEETCFLVVDGKGRQHPLHTVEDVLLFLRSGCTKSEYNKLLEDHKQILGMTN